jgi:hypothetical protein
MNTVRLLEVAMPTLTKILTDEDVQHQNRMQRIDLTPYLATLDAVREQAGVGGILTLSEGESQRTEKRRMSTAAKARGLHLTWRSSQPGQLRFVVAENGQRAPGSRARRQSVPEPEPVHRGGRRKAS